MTISAPVQGTAAANSVAATTLNVPYPTVSAGDVLELQVEVSSATAPDNGGALVAAGWTLQVDLTAGGSSPHMRVWTIYATGSETGSLAVTTPNVTSQGRMRAYTGVDQTTLLDATPGTYSNASASTAFTISQVTTTTANTMLSVVGIGNTNSGAWTAPTSQGGGWTKDWDNASPTPKSVHCYLLWSGSGASGTVNLVVGSIRGCAAVIPYRPATGATNFNIGSSVALTDTVTSAAQVGVSGDVSVPLTDTITSGAVVGTIAAAAIALTCAITASAVVGVQSGVSVPVTATITSTASVGSTGGLSGDVSVPLTDTIASQAVVGVSSGASLAETATVTSAAVVGKQSGATLAETATVASAAVVGVQSGAALSETATITSGAQVGTVAVASIAPTFAVTSQGVVGKVAGATVGVTFVVTATATVQAGGPAVPYIDLTIPARLGTLVIPEADRTLTIPARRATLVISETHRTLVIPAVKRTLTIPEV